MTEFVTELAVYSVVARRTKSHKWPAPNLHGVKSDVLPRVSSGQIYGFRLARCPLANRARGSESRVEESNTRQDTKDQQRFERRYVASLGRLCDGRLREVAWRNTRSDQLR